MWSTMECSQTTAWTSNRSLLVASLVKALFGRQTIAASPYPELRTWKAADLSVIWVVRPALHLRLLLLRDGDIGLNPGPTCSVRSKSIRCDTTPIHCSSCQRHIHRNCCRFTQSQRGIQGFVSFLCFGVLLPYHLRRPSPVPANCRDE